MSDALDMVKQLVAGMNDSEIQSLVLFCASVKPAAVNGVVAVASIPAKPDVVYTGKPNYGWIKAIEGYRPGEKGGFRFEGKFLKRAEVASYPEGSLFVSCVTGMTGEKVYQLIVRDDTRDGFPFVAKNYGAGAERRVEIPMCRGITSGLDAIHEVMAKVMARVGTPDVPTVSDAGALYLQDMRDEEFEAMREKELEATE